MKKLWVRVIVSLLVGGGLQEFMRIRTGKDEGVFLFIGFVLTFLGYAIYSYISNLIRYKKAEIEYDKKEKDDSIIDNLNN